MYDIIGYADTVNGEVYCCDCVEEGDKQTFSPIFSYEEWDCQICCYNCREKIDICVISYEGEERKIIIENVIDSYYFTDVNNNICDPVEIRYCEMCGNELEYNYLFIIQQLEKNNLLCDKHHNFCCSCKHAYDMCKRNIKT